MPLRVLLAAAAAASAAGTGTPECEQRTMYSSRKPGNELLFEKPLAERSAQVCSDVCKATAQCGCFTFDQAKQQCWLLKRCSAPNTGEKFVAFTSGLPGCRDSQAATEAADPAPPREDQPAECQLDGRSAAPGTRVYRGRDWRWKDQDGGYGRVGVLLERTESCPQGAWWRVKWDATGVQNTYRAGCSGQYDLRLADCGAALSGAPSSCPFNEVAWPAGAVPGAEPGCEQDRSVAAGAGCSFSKMGSRCDSVTCANGSWSTKTPKCGPEAAPACPFDSLRPEQGALPSAHFPGCHQGGLVSVGASCVFKKDGHECEMARCGDGAQWSTQTPKCAAPAPCPFDALSVPAGAAVSGDAGCAPGKTVAPGSFCNFAKPDALCEMAACEVGGKWSRNGPKCSEVRCQFDALAVSALASPREPGCAKGGAVTPGATCSFFTAGGAPCGAVVCGENAKWSAPAVVCAPRNDDEQGAPASETPPAQSATPSPAPTPAPTPEAPPAPTGPCRLLPAAIKVGMKVTRGADWKWKDQDGGGWGNITSLKTQKCNGGRWVRVQWQMTGFINIYRAGCQGKWDLCKFVKAVRGGGGRADDGVGAAGRGSGAGRGLGTRTAVEEEAAKGVSSAAALPAPPTEPVPATEGAPAADPQPPPQSPQPAAAEERKAPATYQCREQTTSDAEAILEVPAVASLAICQGYCGQLAGCKAVTYAAASRLCIARGAGAPAPSDGQTLCTRDLPDGPGLTSAAAAAAEQGDLPSAPGWSCAYGGMAGEEVFQVHAVTTISDCVRHCADSGECGAVEYAPGDAYCRFLSGPTRRSPDSSKISCLPTTLAAPGSSSFMCKREAGFKGGNLRIVTAVPTRGACEDICTKAVDCVALVHNREQQTCALKAYVVGPEAAAPEVEACARVPAGSEPEPQQQESRLGELVKSDRHAHGLTHFSGGPVIYGNGDWVQELVLRDGVEVVRWRNTTSGETTYERPPGFDYQCWVSKYYEGASLFRLVGIDDAYKCQQACDSLPACVGFVHRGACPKISEGNNSVPDHARCHTCDLKAIANASAMLDDDEWRATTTCIAKNREPSEVQWEARYTLELHSCDCQSGLATTAAALEAFLDGIHDLMAQCGAPNPPGPPLRSSLHMDRQQACLPGFPCMDFPVPGYGSASRQAQRLSLETEDKILMWRETRHGSVKARVAVVQEDPTCKAFISYAVPTSVPTEDVDDYVENCAQEVLSASANRSSCGITQITTDVRTQVEPPESCEWDVYTEHPECTAHTDSTACNESLGCQWTRRHPGNCSLDAPGPECRDNECQSGKEIDPECCIMRDVHVANLAECKARCNEFTGVSQGFNQRCTAITYDPQACTCTLYKACCPVRDSASPTTQLCTINHTTAQCGVRACFTWTMPISITQFTQEKFNHLIVNFIHSWLQGQGIDVDVRTIVLDASDLGGQPPDDDERRWIANSTDYVTDLSPLPDPHFAARKAHAQEQSRLSVKILPQPGGSELVIDEELKRSAAAEAAAAVMRKLRPRRYRCETDWSYEGGDLTAIEDVRSADDCLQLCTKTPDCAKTVYTKGRRCVLKGSAASPVVAKDPGAAVACERDDSRRHGPQEYRCEEGVAYGGGDIIVAQEIPTADVCRTLCDQLSPECSLYIWKADGSCRLKVLGETAKMAMPGVQGTVCAAVPAGLSDDYTCRDGAYLGGDLFSVDDVATVADCQRYCSAVRQCTAVGYDARKRCVLKSAHAAFQSDPTGWAEGARACRKVPKPGVEDAAQEQFHCDEHWGYVGEELKRVDNVDSADTCLSMCTAASQCAVVVYRDGSCSLKPASARALPDPGAVSCVRRRPQRAVAALPAPKAEGAKYQCDSRATYEGGDLFQVENIEAAESCRAHCSGVPSCAVYVYSKGVCFLKTAEARRHPATDTGAAVSCVKSREGAADSVSAVTEPAPTGPRYRCESGVSYDGTLVTIENAGGLEHCKRHCDTVPECAAAMLTPAKACTLIGRQGEKVLGGARGNTVCTKYDGSEADRPVAASYTCHEGSAPQGAELLAVNADDAGECRRQCSATPGCGAAVLHRGTNCVLLSDTSVGEWSVAEDAVGCLREKASGKAPELPAEPYGYRCQTGKALLGGPLFDIHGVPSSAACLRHCHKVSSECKAFAFSADGTCELRSAGAQVVDDAGGLSIVCLDTGDVPDRIAPDEAEAQFRCGVVEGPGAAALETREGVADSADCLGLCARERACGGFVYWRGGKCELRSAAAEWLAGAPQSAAVAASCQRVQDRSKAPAPAANQGQAAAAFRCVSNAVFAGGDLWVLTAVASQDECTARCAAEPRCHTAVHQPRGVCHLKSAEAVPVPFRTVASLLQRRAPLADAPPQGGACVRRGAAGRAAAALAAAEEGFRCQSGTTIVGGELLKLPKMVSEDCQRQCTKVARCDIAVLGGDWSCSLHETQGAAQVPDPTGNAIVCRRGSAAAVAAAVAAGGGFDCSRAGGFAGDDLLSVDGVATAEDCVAHCVLVSGCHGAAFSAAKRSCTLSGPHAQPLPPGGEGDVACSRRSVKDAGPRAAASAAEWTCRQSRMVGGDLFLLEGISSLRVCQQQCDRLSSCAAVEHDAPSAVCLLKTRDASMSLSDAKGAASAVACVRHEQAAGQAAGLPQCACAAQWLMPGEAGKCGERQRGCPRETCDGSERRWCRVANPGCATEGYGGWAYCDDSTPAHREGALVSDRRRGEALAITVPAPAAVMLNLVLTKTTVLVAGKLQAVLGLDFDNSGTVIRIYPDTTAAAAGLLIGDRFLEVAAVDIASVPAPEKAAKVLQAFETAPDGPVAVRVERWTSPEGLVWYFDFAHLLHLPHVTHEVFSGQASPDWTDHNSHDPGTFWVHSRVRSAGGGLLGPTVDNWHALNELIRNELSEIGGRFRENMNPVLSAMQLHPLEAGNIEVAAWSAPRFYRRAPVSKLDIKLIFHDTQCNAGTAQYTAVLAFLSGCLGVNPELLQVHNIERWAMERTHLPACYPSCRGNASLTRLFQCDRSLGEHLGCLNSRGDSIELRRMECREGGNEPEASELEPVDLVGGGSSARRADAQALGGNTDCRIELFVTLLLEQDVTAAEVQRRQHRNVTWTAAELALQSALSATSGPCDASALNLLHVETSYIDERIERRPICRTPAPEGGGWQNESGATPIPDEMPPADFTGWEDEGRAVMSAAIGRHLLQFQKKAAARRPVVQEGGVGKALYDPHRRLERIRRAEEEVLRGRGAARRAHTLQAATGTNPGVIQKEGCRKGVQSVQYGIMSNYWNLNNKQPLNCTLQECIDACLADEDCEGFSREALNTTADDEPSDCYLKRKVLPYCGDQYAWQDWGTYVVRCPPPETNPCTWTMVENAALHVVEEYKTHLQVESAQDCRDICERLDDCIGVSYKRWTGTCWFVHDKQGSHVDHQEYTSYLCRRLVRTPSPYSGYAGTPAPPGWGDCRDHGGRCNSGEGTMCYSGLGTYRCGCAPGYLCDATQSDCSDPAVTKKCVRREITGHACVGDEHGCTAVAGGACYQLEGSDYACGCVHGYHCVGAACGNTTAALNCVPDSCTDAMIGPENWAVIQTIGGNTGDPVFDQLFAGWWSCADCGSLPLPTAPLTPALTQAWTAAQQAAVADARGNCRSGPTPAPTGSMALAAAWVQAWSETLDDASRRQGQCWDMAGRVHIVCQSYKDANWSNASTAAGVPPEALDVSVNYVRVHTDRIHNLSVLLSGVPIDAVFGNGSSDGLSDGLSSTPLERLREEFAAAARVDLGKVAVRRICVERAITGEIIACFDAEGRPEGCFSPGLEFTSTQADVAQSTSINSAAACQDECQANAGCTLFAWNSQTQVCYMRTHTGAGTQSDPDYISGPVRCGVSWSASHCGVVKLSHFSAAAGNGTQCDGLYQPASAVNEWIPVDPIAGNNKDRVLVATTPVGTYACIHKDAVRPTSADSGVSLCPPGADCQNIDWWAANLVCQGATSATIDPLLDQQATICQHASNGTKDLWDKTRGNTGQTADREYLLECPVGRVLMIHDAFYGRSHCHGDLCFSDQDAAPGYRNCATDWCNTTGPLALRESAPGILGKVGGRTCRCEVNNTLLLDGVRGRCGTASQRTCLLKTSAGWLSVQLDENRPGLWLNSCPNENKYLWVKYSCISNVPSREAAVLQNEGPLDVSGVAALCAGGACNLRTDVSVDVPETDVMRVVQRGDGSVDTIAPSDVLPSDAHVVQQIGEPAPGGVGESVDDNVLGDMQTSENLPFVSQLLTALAEQNGQQLADATGINGAVFAGVCHVATSGPRIVCFQDFCQKADEEAMEIIRTACNGAPQCGPNFCNHHGTATGFWGACSCLCDVGYVGDRCDMCGVGRANYPACTAAAPAVAPAGTVPAGQSAGGATPQGPQIPSDSELEDMSFPGLVQLAQREGVWDDDLDTKQGVIRALKQRRDGAPPPPAPPVLGVGAAQSTPRGDLLWQTFHVVLAVPPADVTQQSVLEQQLLQLLQPYSAKAVSAQYVCRAAVCVPECPAGAVAQWDREQRESCAHLGQPISAGGGPDVDSPFVQAAGSSVLEFRVGYSAHGDDPAASLSAQSAMTVVALEGMVGRTDTPLGALGIQGAAQVDEAGAGGQQQQQQQQGIQVSAALRESAVPVATLVAIGCVCFFVVFALYGRGPGGDMRDRRYSDWADGGDTCIIRKDRSEAMGVSWEDHTLVASVIDGSAAARAGLRNFIGRRVTHINGHPVQRLADIRQLSNGATELHLRFNSEDIPVCLHVNTAYDHFSEDRFVEELADAIDLPAHKIGVVNVTEEAANSLIVTVTFAGASPTFVRDLLDMCDGPHSKLARRLGISAASVAHDSSELNPVGVNTGQDFDDDDCDLYVSSQWADEPVAAGSGGYKKVEGFSMNGQPAWEKVTGGHWLYSTPNGHWCVTSSPKEFCDGLGIMRTQAPHGGANPEDAGPWETEAGVDADIVVSTRPIIVQGFRVGQRITSAEDITERSRIIVPIGQPGWVKGAASKIPDCGLKVRFDSLDRDVNVLPEEVDNARGPLVNVLSPGKVWRQCMIVNSNQTHLKVHYIGYDHDYDEWIEQGSDRIERVAASFPEGATVRLAPQAQSRQGVLADGSVGVIVRDAGPQHRTPYKVRGPQGDFTWYSGDDLVMADDAAAAVAAASATGER
eukprot:TRINITY_DN14_c0_g1_i12.p1 TRINITY_DN14_c0_g1~~TRINITY_DN14_c0_g1_i12.p1  ORF type:complete len:5186 (+),score=1759.30 TRINITY_DN14_c0_g1_i12:106-15558(+)